MPEHFTPSGFQFAYDNTSISTFKDCPRKYLLQVVNGWRPKGHAPPLLFGGLIHELLEAWAWDTRPHEEKLLSFVKDLFRRIKPTYPTENVGKRTFLNLLRTFIWYVDEFEGSPIEPVILNNRPAVELSFRIEFPHAYQSAPNGVIYCGHIDQVVSYQSRPYIFEHKHTVWQVNDQYLARYNPNAQISGYVWASKIAFEIPASGAIIDIIQIGDNFSRFFRVPEPRTPAQISEWLTSTSMWIGLIEYSFLHNYFPLNEESCTKYGGCPFRKVCSVDSSVRQNYLQADFIQNQWQPLAIRGATE